MSPSKARHQYDPEVASRHAIADGLLVHRAHPLNGEILIHELIGGAVPKGKFYVRNHFQIPHFDPDTWRLSVHGLVDRPLSLSARDLAGMPSQSKIVTLECAGNGRSTLRPRAAGEQWNLGAVSTAEWTGVPLTEVLDRAGPRPDARYVVFRGADSGTVEGHAEPIAFERSLSVEDARESEALLACAMNGEPLPLRHGFPLRMIVPGWYAVASVKWLTEIELVDRPFKGHYQTESYYFERDIDGKPDREPLSLLRVRSLITQPVAESRIARGELAIRGVAWSGAAPIATVEVSLDDSPWKEAGMFGEGTRHGWQCWELTCRIDQPGPCVIRARATDMAGRVQPESPEWNRLGYCNNAIQQVRIEVH